MSWIGEFLNAGTGGVLTGIVGNIITGISAFKLQKQKDEHELNMVKANTTAMIAEVNANIEISEVELKGDLAKSDNALHLEGIKQEGVRIMGQGLIAKLLESPWTMLIGMILSLLFGLVDFLKAVIRPGITIYLVTITSWITWVSYNILTNHNELMTTDQAYSMFNYMVENLIFLTITCVTWWFADRRNAKFQSRLNNGNKTK